MKPLRVCKDCGFKAYTEDDLKLFRSSVTSKYGRSNYCKSCSNKRQQITRQQFKYDACMYKGGQCIKCGLKVTTTNTPVFEFHHLDRTQKEYQFSYKTSSLKHHKKELDKCVLLCSNCHRMEHSVFAEYSWSI